MFRLKHRLQTNIFLTHLSLRKTHSLRIGGINIPIISSNSPENIPNLYTSPYLTSQESLAHIRWLTQKDLLGQDSFLIGSPGPYRRRLALAYCELAGREIEVVTLSQDTTEADLKQRREIVNGSAIFIDQAPVRAAIEGRVLILEGIEKAERNVLPILNNLLENREMSLSDGRFLVSPSRYDSLIESGHTHESLSQRGLVRVSPKFRVIALGLPVPEFPGHPLDPPLRSRFQSRYISPPSFQEQLKYLTSSLAPIPPQMNPNKFAQSILLFLQVLDKLKYTQGGLLDSYRVLPVPSTAYLNISKYLTTFPLEGFQRSPFLLLQRIYPFHLFNLDLAQNTGISKIIDSIDSTGTVDLDSVTLKDESSVPTNSKFALNPSYAYLRATSVGSNQCRVTFQTSDSVLSLPAVSGQYLTNPQSNTFINVLPQWSTLSLMMQSHTLGYDICLVGVKGCGKSIIADYFAQSLGYAQPEKIFCYKDMTPRDLLQRRRTDSHGNTHWQLSPLVIAALEGNVAILDGVNRLTSDTLSVLNSLVNDREIHLSDGRRLIRHDRYDELIQNDPRISDMMKEKHLLRIHPSFRIISLATPPTKENPWCTAEILGIFSFIDTISPLTIQDKLTIISTLHPLQNISSITPHVEQKVFSLFSKIYSELEGLENDSSNEVKLSAALSQASFIPSCRQLLRLWRACGETIDSFPNKSMLSNIQGDESFPPEILQNMRERIRRMFMVPFMPPTLRDSFDNALERAGLSNLLSEIPMPNAVPSSLIEGQIRIGNALLPLNNPSRPELVPNTLFVEIPAHIKYLENIAHDILAGEKHILLIGNQGTGKNKIVDRLLHVIGWEREYMQLHRDTTVQSLTVTPTLTNGVISYDDSPVIKAVKYGRVLVLDEADKAPTEIVVILKGLLEDGQLLLEDGRKIISNKFSNQISPSQDHIVMHPNFRLFVLANRPGYPFLGNDFFREAGDCFSVHIIDNPPYDSQLQMLKAYATNSNAKEHILRKLVAAFFDLKKLHDEGTLTYPYSMRELVSVVKHLDNFPMDGVANALDNVLSWDGIGTGERHSQANSNSRSGKLQDSSTADLIRSVLLEHGIAASDMVRNFGGSNMEFNLLSRIQSLSVGNDLQLEMEIVEKSNYSAFENLKQTNSGYLFGKKKVVGAENVVSTRSLIFNEEIQRWSTGNFDETIGATKPTPIAMTRLHDSLIILTKNPATLQTYNMKDLTQGLIVDISTTLGTLNSFLVPSPDHKHVYLSALSGGFLHAIHDPDFTIVKKIELPEAFYGKISQSSPWLIASRRKQINQEIFPGNASAIDSTHIAHTAKEILILNSNPFETDSTNLDASYVKIPSVSLLHQYHIAQSWCLTKDSMFLLLEHDSNKQNLLSRIEKSTQPLYLHLIRNSENQAITFSLVKNIDSKVLGVHQLSNQESVNVNGFEYPENTTLIHTEKEIILVQRMAESPLTHRIQIPTQNIPSEFTKSIYFPAYTKKSGPFLVTIRNNPASVDLLDFRTCKSQTYDFGGGEEGILSLLQSGFDNQPSAAIVDIVSVQNDQDDFFFHVLFSNNTIRVFQNLSQDPTQGQELQEYREMMGNQDNLNNEPLQIEIISTESGKVVNYFEFKESQGPPEIFPVDPSQGDGISGGGTGQGGDGSSGNGNGGSGGSGGGGGGGSGGGGGGGSSGSGGGGGSGGALASNGSGGFTESQRNSMSHLSVEQLVAIEENVQRLAQFAIESAQRVHESPGSISSDLQRTPALDRYEKLSDSIRTSCGQLRVILESAEAKQHEREWLKNQMSGDIDDQKLVDGITGEGRIFRRRGNPEKKHGLHQSKPKRLAFLLDCSASMARMSQWDGRLDRMASCAALIMEGLSGFEHKFDYTILGHSGQTNALPLVNYGTPPKTIADRAAVVDKIYSHSRGAPSGDKSLESASLACHQITKEDADDYLVFLFSDANLGRYGISPAAINASLKGDGRCQGYCIFIAEPDAASWIVDELPFGRGFVVLDPEKLPQTFKEIFSHALVES